jgi:hypothetical protein
MVDIRAYLPVRGNQCCRIYGGPHDKLGLDFDDPPKEIIMDGHRYLARPIFENEDEEIDEESLNSGEYLETIYEYQGKVAK